MDEFSARVYPLLDLIDHILALDGVAIRSRPLSAALMLVRDFIPSIRIGDDPPQSPGEPKEFTIKPWFRPVYGHVELWYRNRYRSRVERNSIREWRATTLVAATPFELRVPVSTGRVEVLGESAWLSFPDRILPDEQVLTWMQEAPDWHSYTAEARATALSDAEEIVGLVRKISCRMIGADVSDSLARNLLAGIQVHLQSASDLIMSEGAEGAFARAQWELQMACESAYKGSLQQMNGSFPATHDLFVLHDLAQQTHSSVDRAWLRELPRWHEAANLRYGIGDHPTVIGIQFWYRLTLEIIAGVVVSLRGMDLSQTKLLLRRPPWLADEIPAQDCGHAG